MALDEVALAQEIMDEMENLGLAPRNPLNSGKSELIWEALAKAIVDHIKTNAEVPIPGGSSAGTYQVT